MLLLQPVLQTSREEPDAPKRLLDRPEAAGLNRWVGMTVRSPLITGSSTSMLRVLSSRPIT